MPIENLRYKLFNSVYLHPLFKKSPKNKEKPNSFEEDGLSKNVPASIPKLSLKDAKVVLQAPQGAPTSGPSKPLRILDEASRLARAHDPNVEMSHWQQVYGGDESRAQYAKAFWSAVLTAAEKIDSGSGMSSQELIKYLGGRRRNVAFALKHDNAASFGKSVLERSHLGEIWTPVMPRYGNFPHVTSFLEKIRVPDARPFGDALRATDYLPGKLWTVHAEDALGQHITLSATADISVNIVRWFQCAPSEQLNRQIEFLYRQALRAPEGHTHQRMEKLCISIGRLHWWMAQHCPFERGSAAVFDMVSSTLFRHHGFNHAGWKPQVSADVVAICTPDPEVFAQSYRGLMRQDPVAFR